jgi:hypothetical protein
MVELLIREDADINAPAGWGRGRTTPFDTAKSHPVLQAAKLVLDHHLLLNREKTGHHSEEEDAPAEIHENEESAAHADIMTDPQAHEQFDNSTVAQMNLHCNDHTDITTDEHSHTYDAQDDMPTEMQWIAEDSSEQEDAHEPMGQQPYDLADILVEASDSDCSEESEFPGESEQASLHKSLFFRAPA